MSLSKIELTAPAKLNLHLSVTGRRADGYHFLETLMVKLDLADDVLIVTGESGIQLKVNGLRGLPEGEGNVAFRAARAFFETANLPQNAGIILNKRIPVAAGLGGGSSDAAAVLNGLNHLHGQPLSRKQLLDLGLTLGADVPFFILPDHSAWAKGIGEELFPWPDIPNLHFLLINPGWPLSTAWVYENFKLVLTSTDKRLISSQFSGGSFIVSRDLHNDLESVVMPRYPELETVKNMLLAEGAVGALMTGSGPTVFGVFTDRQKAGDALNRLRKRIRQDWIILSARNLNQLQPGPGVR